MLYRSAPILGILRIVQIRIDAALGQQFLVGTAFGDMTIRNGDDPMGRTNGGQTVGNDQGSSANGQIVKRTLDLCLRYGVQRRSGFVVARVELGSQISTGIYPEIWLAI